MCERLTSSQGHQLEHCITAPILRACLQRFSLVSKISVAAGMEGRREGSRGTWRSQKQPQGIRERGEGMGRGEKGRVGRGERPKGDSLNLVIQFPSHSHVAWLSPQVGEGGGKVCVLDASDTHSCSHIFSTGKRFTERQYREWKYSGW